MVISGLSACSAKTASTQSLRLAVNTGSTLDPAFAQDPTALSLASACYQSLFTVEAGSAAATPALASSVATTDGQQTFTIRLRDDATFADGSVVRASDVVATLQRVRDPATKSPLAPLLGAVNEIRTDGPATVVITTKTGFGELPVVLAHPGLGIVDGRTVSDAGKLRTSCQGSGAYRSESDAAGRVVLTRRSSSGAAPPKITLVVTGDPDAAEAALEQRRVDVAFVSGDVAPKGNGYEPYTAVSYIELNPYAPELQDARFREAIVRGLNAGAIVSAGYGETASVLPALVPSAMVGASKMRCVDACAFDPNRAAQLVRAVFPNGAPSLTFDYDSGSIPGKVAEEVVKQLGAIGVTARAVPNPPEEYARLLLSGKAQLFRFGWVGPYAGAGAFLQSLFASGGEVAILGPIAGLDEPLAKAQAATEPEVAAAAFADAADAVLAQWVVKPVAVLKTHWVTRSGVQGLRVSPQGAIDLSALRTRAGTSG